MCSVDDTGDVRDERNGNKTDYAMMITDVDTALRILIRRQVFRSRTPVQVLPLWTHRRFDSESDHKVYIGRRFLQTRSKSKTVESIVNPKRRVFGQKDNQFVKIMFNLIVIGLSFDLVTFKILILKIFLFENFFLTENFDIFCSSN